MNSAIIPPARKENIILDKTNLYPIMAPMAEKSFISPAPSIFSKYKGIRHIMGISIPMKTVYRLLIPLIHRLVIIPANTEGSIMVFLILYVFISLNKASTNSSANKIVSINLIYDLS